MRARSLPALALLALLAACATPQTAPMQPTAYIPPPGCGGFSSNPEFAPLRGKVALDNLAEQTPAMQKLGSRPGKRERALLQNWSAQRLDCLAAEQQAAKNWSTEAMSELDTRYLEANRGLDGELIAARISYGEYARRRQTTADAYNDAWQARWSEQQARIQAERRAQAERYWQDRYYYDDYYGGYWPYYRPGYWPYYYGRPWGAAGYYHYPGHSGTAVSIGVGYGF